MKRFRTRVRLPPPPPFKGGKLRFPPSLGGRLLGRTRGARSSGVRLPPPPPPAYTQAAARERAETRGARPSGSTTPASARASSPKPRRVSARRSRVWFAPIEPQPPSGGTLGASEKSRKSNAWKDARRLRRCARIEVCSASETARRLFSEAPTEPERPRRRSNNRALTLAASAQACALGSSSSRCPTDRGSSRRWRHSVPLAPG
jgi:hypothetical protein